MEIFSKKVHNFLEIETSKKSLYFRKRDFLSNNFPRSKIIYTFSYKEAKLFKLNYFLIIIT